MNVMPCLKKCARSLYAVALVAATVSYSARVAPAQGARIASVAAVQRIAEKKDGAAVWKRANSGAALGVDSRLRTGKRSKADVRFTDGSLLRLGQLSSVEFKSAKGVTLTGGQLLYAALKPGRVLAGVAAAEIKGSVALIRLNADNSVDAELFLGATDITTDKGTIQLKPGQGVTTFPDGTFSRIRTASPRAYSRTGLLSELLEAPATGPFTGSSAQIPVRTAPERTAIEAYGGIVRGPQGLSDFSNPTLDARRSPFGPFPTPFPPLPRSHRIGSHQMSARRDFAMSDETSRAQTRISSATIGKPSSISPRGTAFDGTFFQGSPIAGWMGGPTRALEPAASPVLLAQVPAANAEANAEIGAGESGAVARAVDAASDLGLSDADALDTAAAMRHLEEIDRAQGQVSGVDAAILGVLADGGTALYGGQLHGFVGRGKFLADVSLRPLRLRRSGEATKDYSAFNSANVRYRDSWGEIQAGRQRFVAGPTQATLFGSLVRQGSREIMDAVRIAPRLKDGLSFEAAYLFDAYPRNLPYRIGGRQQGFYARAALERRFGNVGVNLLNYRGLNTSTGATLDFTFPLVRDKIEFYGEAGRDVFRRRLTTVGLAFPALFDSADIDLAIEYSDLGSSRRAAAPPSELAVRAYKRVGNNVDILTTVSRFSGAVRDTSIVIGISVGARLVGQGNRYSQ